MKNAITIFSLAVFIGIVSYLLSYTANRKEVSLGSITDGQSYNSTTTDATWNVAPNWRLIKSGQGTFGSIIITKSTTSLLKVYDATTTVNGAIYGTTTLADIGASATSGTYTFDIQFKTGLLVETIGGGPIASTTITWR